VLITSQKAALSLFARRGRVTPPPPFEVNSNGSTLTLGRGLSALGLLTDFIESVKCVNNLAKGCFEPFRSVLILGLNNFEANGFAYLPINKDLPCQEKTPLGRVCIGDQERFKNI